MNDNRTTAIIVLVMAAFVFWLYNTGKLTTVVSAVTGSGSPNSFGIGGTIIKPNASGGIPALPGLPGLTPHFMDGSGNTLLPVKPLPMTDQFGNAVKDENGNPVYIAKPTSNANLNGNYQGFSTILNSIPIFNGDLIQFLPPLETIVPSGLEAFFA